MGVFNGLLGETEEERRFYITGDNGQGALVFFCMADWAARFEKTTEISPGLIVTKSAV